MKVIVFLCFALIACNHMAAAISRAEILSLLQQTNVDNVLELLQGLSAAENQDLNALDAAYNENEPVLAAAAASALQLLQQKDAACAAIEKQVADGRDQEQRLRDNIQAAQDTIAANQKKAEAAADARCASNLLFISELGNREEAVDFLSYLRARVADPAFADYIKQQSGAFLQIKNALDNKKEHEILSLLAKHHMLSLLQKGKQNYEGEADLGSELNAGVRTSDEVGTDYQDNSRGALDVQHISADNLSVDAYIAKLLGYIDQLVASLRDDVAKLQAAETAAVQAFIQYQQQLKDQNYVLKKYIESATNNLNQLVATDDANEAAGKQCRAEEVPLQEGSDAAKAAHTTYVQTYQTRRANLSDALALLGQVIQLYTQEVLNVAPESYKERADDYLDNQVFDSTESFTARTDFSS